MNQQSYEEYIRSILGYPNTNPNECTAYDSNFNTMPDRQNADNVLLEECYPEIYKIVYPMIVKTCRNCTGPINRELVEEMTDEIYKAVEPSEIDINITLNNEVNNTTQNNNSNNTTNFNNTRKEMNRQSTSVKKEQENRGEDRQFRNRNLRDLIQILLIRELLGRPGFHGHRPPFPRPPRPPFPGGPGPRPPIMPRGNIEYQYPELFEN